MKNMRMLLLWGIAFAAISAQVLIVESGRALVIWRAPLSWGPVKDFLDISLVLLFAWGGWPAAIIVIGAALLGNSARSCFLVIVIAAIVHGAANTLISFHEPTIAKALAGIFTFGFIYFIAALIAMPIGVLLRNTIGDKYV